MADTFFVSAACGATGLAALNLAFPIFCLINGLGLCLGIGGGSQYVFYQTQARQDTANQVFSKTIQYGLGFSLICIVCSFLFSKQIVYFLGADSITFSMTHIYVKILLLFAPGFLFNTILQSFVRNDGGPVFAMASMIGSSLFNIVFDAYFIFVLDWGILGAILATSLAPWVSLCILSLYWIQKKNRLTWQVGIVQTKILSSGLPFFFNECASAFLMIFFNFLFLKTIGTFGVSAFSIVTVLSLAVTAIFNGCSQGIQPLLSHQAGIQDKENIRRIFKYSLYTILVLSIVLYSVLFFYTNPIVSIFNQHGDLTLQVLAELGTRLYFLAIPFLGLNVFSMMYLSTTGFTNQSKILSLLHSFMILLPVAIILTYRFGSIGLWCAYPCSELIVFGFSIFFLSKFRYTKKA